MDEKKLKAIVDLDSLLRESREARKNGKPIDKLEKKIKDLIWQIVH